MDSSQKQKYRRNPSPKSHERGQSLVELAISLPVILMLLVGTYDFGMAIFSSMILRDAAQEGALYGSIDPANIAEIERRARGISPHETKSPLYLPFDLNDPELVQVTIQTSAGHCQKTVDGNSNVIEVSVSYNYPTLTPFMQQILGSDTIPLTAIATNVILQPPCQ